MRDYTKLQKAGNKAGLEKLKARETKYNSLVGDVQEAYRLLVDEVEELGFEVFKHFWVGDRLKEIRHEAADVRNFADMIILACDEGLKK